MNDEQKHAMAKDILSSARRSRNVFTFIPIFSSLSLQRGRSSPDFHLVLDCRCPGSRQRTAFDDLLASYVGIAFAVINLLFLIAILKRPLFRQGDEQVSLARIKAVNPWGFRVRSALWLRGGHSL
jgi:hypothetical protein